MQVLFLPQIAPEVEILRFVMMVQVIPKAGIPPLAVTEQAIPKVEILRSVVMEQVVLGVEILRFVVTEQAIPKVEALYLVAMDQVISKVEIPRLVVAVEIFITVARQILLTILQRVNARAITDTVLITIKQAVCIARRPTLLRQLLRVRSILTPIHPANAHVIMAMW